MYDTKIAFQVLCIRYMGSSIYTVRGRSAVKNSAAEAGDASLVPGSGRFPGEGNSNPFQYSCLEIPWAREPGSLQSTWLQKSWT